MMISSSHPLSFVAMFHHYNEVVVLVVVVLVVALCRHRRRGDDVASGMCMYPIDAIRGTHTRHTVRVATPNIFPVTAWTRTGRDG